MKGWRNWSSIVFFWVLYYWVDLFDSILLGWPSLFDWNNNISDRGTLVLHAEFKQTTSTSSSKCRPNDIIFRWWITYSISLEIWLSLTNTHWSWTDWATMVLLHIIYIKVSSFVQTTTAGSEVICVKGCFHDSELGDASKNNRKIF